MKKIFELNLIKNKISKNKKMYNLLDIKKIKNYKIYFIFIKNLNK